MNARKVQCQFLGCALSLTLLSGCALMDNMSSGSSSSEIQSTQYTYLDQQLKTLTERLNGVEQSNANLQRDLADVQTRLSQLQAGANGQASASDLQQLKAQVQALEAQREKDKQVILDQVAKEIAGMASATKRSRATAESSGGNDVGYEHIVKQGQTLTDIAKAYGVTVTAIKKANNLTSNNLRVGQKLFIPKTQ